MADGARPFVTFNFKVNLQLTGAPTVVCGGAFAECEGLEMSMEVKTIREGGNNTRPILLAGAVSYGQLTLRRGMTADLCLWRWFDRVQQTRTLRASGDVIVLSSDRAAEVLRFTLTGCLPMKIKAPALNAKDGMIAIEEMQIGYETLRLEAPAA